MNLFRRKIFLLGPDGIALIVFTLFWMVLIIIYGGKIHFVEGSTVLPSIILVGLVAISAISYLRYLWAHKNAAEKVKESFFKRLVRLIRDWIPLIALIAVYETLREYTGIIRKDSIDSILYLLDVKLLGAEPTVWIQKFIHPFWTDYFAFMYVLYFVMPMFVSTMLYVKGRRQDFKEVSLGCVLCMYGGYILYLVFPAGPPRYFDGIVFNPEHLTGLFGFFEFTQGKMDTSSHVMHKSSFPSLHCALSMLALFQACRFGDVWKKNVVIGLVGLISVSIWIATVYLRHHWFVDILAGWLLALISFFLAKKITAYWFKKEAYYSSSSF